MKCNFKSICQEQVLWCCYFYYTKNTYIQEEGINGSTWKSRYQNKTLNV